MEIIRAAGIVSDPANAIMIFHEIFPSKRKQKQTEYTIRPHRRRQKEAEVTTVRPIMNNQWDTCRRIKDDDVIDDCSQCSARQHGNNME